MTTERYARRTSQEQGSSEHKRGQQSVSEGNRKKREEDSQNAQNLVFLTGASFVQISSAWINCRLYNNKLVPDKLILSKSGCIFFSLLPEHLCPACLCGTVGLSARTFACSDHPRPRSLAHHCTENTVNSQSRLFSLRCGPLGTFAPVLPKVGPKIE